MFGFFRKKPPVQPPGDSPENWHEGDIAECIFSGPWFVGGVRPTKGPKKGARNRVTSVVIKPHIYSGEPVQLLELARFDGYYIATGFRKVRPQADERIAATANWPHLIVGKPSRRRDRQPDREAT
jgi:hypothetical protein